MLLRCHDIVDDVGDHTMPENSVFQTPYELCWTHIAILLHCTETVHIRQFLMSLALLPSIFTVTTKFSKPCLLKSRHEKAGCH